MSNAWFHTNELPDSGRIVLSGREARHAARSRRLEEGDRITLFNGRGVVARAVIGATRRGTNTIEAEILEHEVRLPLLPALHLVCALPKGDRQSTLLNMATQLGMTSFTPLLTEYIIVTPGLSFRERAERIVIEACKQSHQPFCPMIHDPMRLSDVNSINDSDSEFSIRGERVLFDPAGAPIATCLENQASGSDSFVLVIGPEGGFTDQELSLARESGIVIAALGTLVLRIETAAIAAIARLRL